MTTQTPRTHHRRRRSTPTPRASRRSRRPAATGPRSPRRPPASARSGSSSTWARSTRRPTACSGSMLEIDGETVTEARAGIGYLHTGIEKNMEFRTWTQGVTFCTRMDYVAPLFQEAAYCLAVEKLLGITDDVPERATVIRVLMMELNRITSHLVCLGHRRQRAGRDDDHDRRLHGPRGDPADLRADHRPAHEPRVHPPGRRRAGHPAGRHRHASARRWCSSRHYFKQLEDLMMANPILHLRLKDVGYLSLSGCMALGVTRTGAAVGGPAVRRAQGQPVLRLRDVRLRRPHRARRRLLRPPRAPRRGVLPVDEDRRAGPGPPRRRWVPARSWSRTRRSPGLRSWPSARDGMGNSLDHIREIMGTSMEALIHHFKLVTEGFRVPAGQVFQTVEHPRGELGVHLVSDGGTRPYRAHFRDPSFNNLQAHVDHVRGRAGGRRRRRRRVPRPGAGRGGPLMSIETSRTGQTGRRTTPRRTRASTADADAIVARYPQARSALLPMLHLVQSEDGYVSPRGIAFCADAARPDHRRGVRGRDVLHAVQAAPQRHLHRGRLHQHAVRDHGRRRHLRGPVATTSASATTRPPTTARSPSSASSATRPATTRPS